MPKDRIILSTVRISLSEQPPGPAQRYNTPVSQAFSESVSSVFIALRVLVIAVAYAAPHLVIFDGLLAILGSGTALASRAMFRRLAD